MKTIAIEDDIYDEYEIIAAQHNCSVDAIIQEILIGGLANYVKYSFTSIRQKPKEVKHEKVSISDEIRR